MALDPRDECPDCGLAVGWIGGMRRRDPSRAHLACQCSGPDLTLPADPDEAMRELRGCSLAEYAATRQHMIEMAR